MPPKALPIAAPPSNWSGFYVGATLGAGQDSSKTSELWSWSYPTGTLIGIGGGPLFATTAPLNFTTKFFRPVSSLRTRGNWRITIGKAVVWCMVWKATLA
jgi:hypothetical protein